MSFDRRELSKLSKEELQEKKKSLRSEVSRLGSALQEEEQEVERLKGRIRKGDPSAQKQISEQKKTVKQLRSEKSTKRSRLKAVRATLQKATASSTTASKPRYGV